MRRRIALALVVWLWTATSCHGPAQPATATAGDGAAPLAPDLRHRDATTLVGTVDLLRGHPSAAGDGLVHARIEIPAGTNAKWEIGADGAMRWDHVDGAPRVVRYLSYPANYGIVPRTLLGTELGGDGDPLDVVVLGPAVPRGTLLAVRPIGVIQLVDAGERDDKLLAVRPGDPLGEVADLPQLDAAFPGVTAILRLWFEHYKGANALRCDGFGDRAAAERLLAAAERSFGRAVGGPQRP